MSQRPTYGLTVTRDDNPRTTVVSGLHPHMLGETSAVQLPHQRVAKMLRAASDQQLTEAA